MRDQDGTPMTDDSKVAVETVPGVRDRRRTSRSNSCRMGALQVHSRKHCVNYPSQEERHDYATEVAGGVASHYCFDHVTFDDIVVPTVRRVVKRRTEGPVIHGPTAVLILISDVSLT